MMNVSHEFDPVFDANSKILILGSIPSVTSRKVGFYYSHPQNRFWKVLSFLFQEEIIDKKAFCLKHQIALWDVCSSCTICGSNDASIQNIVPNDLNVIFKVASIERIFTTGKKAYEIYQKYLYPIYRREAIYLPSTSPANASKTLEDLIESYKAILT